MIEAAQNPDSHVPMGWTDEKQTIEPIETARFRFFVRIAGSYRNKEEDVKNFFGNVDVYELYGLDEFAVLTGEMAEGDFRRAAASFDAKEQAKSDFGIKQTIRAVL